MVKSFLKAPIPGVDNSRLSYVEMYISLQVVTFLKM